MTSASPFRLHDVSLFVRLRMSRQCGLSIRVAAAATSASKKPAASIFQVKMQAASSLELLLTATKALESKYHPARCSCPSDTFHSNNLTTQLSKQRTVSIELNPSRS